jgi:hypothetical protein
MSIEDLTRRQVGYLMALLTIVVPYGIFWQGRIDGSIATAIYSFIWVLRFFDGEFFAFHMFNIFYTFTAVSTGFFGIPFAVQVVRCIKSDASRKLAYLMGLLSLYIPTGFGISAMFYVLDNYDVLYYMGPIPIQFVIGILLLYKTKSVIVDRPWEESTHQKEGTLSQRLREN